MFVSFTQIITKGRTMDLVSIISILAIIIGIFTFPSSAINKLEQKISSKIFAKNSPSEVIDIEKINKSLE